MNNFSQENHVSLKGIFHLSIILKNDHPWEHLPAPPLHPHLNPATAFCHHWKKWFIFNNTITLSQFEIMWIPAVKRAKSIYQWFQMAQNQENDKINLKLLTRKRGGRSYIIFKPNKKEHQRSCSQKMQESFVYYLSTSCIWRFGIIITMSYGQY